jgi:hypothetical protein
MISKIAPYLCLIVALLAATAQAATIEDVIFLKKIQVYEAVVDTVLVTQEGKRVPIDRGTRLNVAGFTKSEALVVSRSDRPNGFIRKSDVVPAAPTDRIEMPQIKEETLPPAKTPGENTK